MFILKKLLKSLLAKKLLVNGQTHRLNSMFIDNTSLTQPHKKKLRIHLNVCKIRKKMEIRNGTKNADILSDFPPPPAIMPVCIILGTFI